MDRIERTMQFILDQQAVFDARFEARQAAYEERQAKADRQTAQLRRILLTAIRLGRRELTELNQKINILVANQVELQELAKNYLKRSSNGGSTSL